MKSHTDLLNTLIDALYDAPPSPEIHRYQILAAEIRGQMSVTAADTDGWIKNTGAAPEGEILELKFRDGSTYVKRLGKGMGKNDFRWAFSSHTPHRDITHYKPL
jgi:hypothetical protein